MEVSVDEASILVLLESRFKFYVKDRERRSTGNLRNIREYQGKMGEFS